MITTGWFKAEISGNKLKVVFEANKTAEERPLQLTVTAGDIFYTLKFIQLANKQHEVDLENPTATTTLSLSNAPIIDGSDSTEPLRNLLMCRLLGIDCQWHQNLATNGTWGVAPQWHSLSDEDNKTLQHILQNRNTHGSFVSLIDGENDIIITARGISRDEQKYADEKGAQLLSHPVAKDAFVFIVNPKNPVRNLSIEQIQKIYTGEIRNWKEVGGNDATINPYVRNRNSGSQEKMETIVMAGLAMIDWPEMIGYVMLAPYYQLANDENGIAFTPFYYYDTIVNDERTQVIGVNGIVPSKQTIEDDSYPYVTHVMASVRADIDKSSTTYQLFYQLATGQHKDIVKESGYIVYQ
jgi:phosphate transport system substrate-binding protein